ncbi:unnamed protein product, partial [marine sediment metagenome]
KCVACGYCKNLEEIKKSTSREIGSEKTVDDVIVKIAMNRATHRLRFAFQFPEKYRFLHAKAQAAYHMAAIFRKLGKAGMTHSKLHSTVYWSTMYDSMDQTFGLHLFDLLMKGVVPVDEITAAAAKIAVDPNMSAECSSFVGAKYFEVESPLKLTDYGIFLLEANQGVPIDLQERLRAFDPETSKVKLPEKTTSRVPTFVERYLPQSMPDPLMVNFRGHKFLLLTLPLRLS